ncbi:MAG: sulfatase [Verrucomicrobiota bacterium]
MLLLLSPSGALTKEKPNILFIAIDDLRPELGCYGSPIAKSPHMDKLASEGLLFRHAYCQEAICHPSRTSLLTGTRPSTNGVTHNYVEMRELQPDILTLPQHFAANGYDTVYSGKIFHGKWRDEEHSWNRKPSYNRVKVERPRSPYALSENQEIREKNFAAMVEKYGDAARRGLGNGPAYECADVPDHAYLDGYSTEVAIATMKHMAEEGEKPFFMALGFTKPHLNWIAPKKYWDLYNPDEIELANQTEGPEDGAAIGLHPSFELRVRAGIPKYGPIGDNLSRTLLHAYYACVSYVDAQIGKAVAALEEMGVRDNTVIVIWGDHGWHLGEMGTWGKATNYEVATRVPFMIWTPDMETRGEGTDSLVELLDIFPTLCDLAGIPTPDQVEGRSLVPLLHDPSVEIKDVAVSQFPSPALREWAANPLSPEMRETFFGPLIQDVEDRIIRQQGEKWDRDLFENHLMGYAVRSSRHRLVLWRDDRDPSAEPVFVELFDHQKDPNETKNIAAENETVVKRLTKKLNDVLSS